MTTTVEAQGPVDVTVRPAVWVEPEHLKEQHECATRAGYGMVVIANTEEAADKVPLYAIPEGWVLVPERPTTDMLYAMAECDCGGLISLDTSIGG